MNQRRKFVTALLLTLLLVSIGSVTITLAQPSLESRADRIIEVAEGASQKVGDLIDLIYANESALEKIDQKDLTLAFQANVTLHEEGVEKVGVADSLRNSGDFEGAIGNATEALSLFREVYKSVSLILLESDVKLGKVIGVVELEEAIERAQEKVDELKELISENSSIYEKLIDAEDYITEAFEFLSDNLEESKASLRQANILISEVCSYLKELAQELNPQRIWDYCEGAYKYRERFRERFGQAWDEGFNVNGFLEGFGYANEDDFLSKFQEMIQKAQEYEDVEDVLEDLQEIGNLIREMESNFSQEMDRHRGQHGQFGSAFGGEENNGGFEQGDGSYGGYAGSGNRGFGGNH
jgi:uncharacterized membrane protein YgcG